MTNILTSPLAKGRIRHIKSIRPRIPVIVIAGYPDSEMLSRASVQGLIGIMNKPFGESDISMAINSFLQTGKVRRKDTYFIYRQEPWYFAMNCFDSLA